MAATVLNSPWSVAMSILDERTRKQFEEVYRAIRALMAAPASRSRPIGFTADLNGKE